MTSRFCRVPRLIRSPLSPQSALVPVRTLTFSPPNSNILSSRPPTEPVTPATEPGQPAPPPQHTSPASKVKSIVNSVLHGTERGNRDEVADTHSKLLARGKYVHEMQIHNVKPEAMDDYIKLVDEHYPRIANSPEFQVKLFGSWTAEFGELDQAVHLWEYNNYPGYHETQDMLRKDVQFESFERQLRPMLRSRSNQMLLEFAFWQGSPPTVHNGIYELRSYLLKPGRLLEWETEWYLSQLSS
ncbi:hypothetical protein HK104_008034 [Borealophlyctis nickersoniae]|nr:hypothetical protein HK104_008034 [Borealophlyctis nickersoniae]